MLTNVERINVTQNNTSNKEELLLISNVRLRVMFSIVAGLLTLATIIGNLFVLIAVRVNQKLKRIHASILITSLAVADLLVGGTVMPLAVVEIWSGGLWIFGQTICRLWTSMDVICSTASIATLCVISIDRYVGIARPLEYAYLVTRKKLWFSILLVWVFSIAVLLSCMKRKEGDVDDERDLSPTTSCHVGKQLDYVIYSVILSFFIPLAVILAFYYRIYRLAQKRTKSFVETSQGVIRRASSLAQGKDKSKNRYINVLTAPLSLYQINTGDFRKQNKAAVTLALVVGAFVLCWLPFFVLFVISKRNFS